MNRQPLTVAVVGATGVVGRTMIQILNEREFPVGELRLLASGRSAGRTVSIDGRTLEIGEAVPDAFEGVDIALFSAGADISLELAPAAVARGATVIDNSSAWRMDPTIPLVVSQVNPDDLEGHPGIIANPNCSTMQLAPVLMALRDTVGLERVVVDTYQSVSGTGADALAELEGQIRAHVAGEAPVASVYPHPIAFNALPEIDVFLPNGYTKEEWKVVSENRKILAPAGPAHLVHGGPHPGLRQPLRGGPRRDARADHARIGHASCSPRSRASSSRTIPPSIATRWRPRPPGATRSSSGACAATSSIADDRGLAFWVVSDNLRKGAATNAVELAEILRERDWIRPAAVRGASPYAGAWSSRGHGVTEAERRVALEAIAAEVRVCTNCRLHATRTRAVPGEGDPETEVVFVGEGPGFNEDRQGRPFVGRAGDLLVKLLGHDRLAARGRVHHERREVPAARQPRPAARRDRRLRAVPAPPARGPRPGGRRHPRPVLDGDVHARRPDLAGARHGPAGRSRRPARVGALVFAMYHPAAALRTPAIERDSYADIAAVPAALLDVARVDARRADRAGATEPPTAAEPDSRRPARADRTRRRELDAELTPSRRRADPVTSRRRPPN